MPALSRVPPPPRPPARPPARHNARGYEGSALGDTFSLMYFGNSVAAICAGMMAEAAADAKALTATDSPPWYYGGYTAPFDLSALFLVLAFGLISAFWTENYGEESPAARHAAGWKRALHPV